MTAEASSGAVQITEILVPKRNETYVPFGFYNDLKSILNSGVFYPIYITGLSGNGKTMMVEQVCAELGRELIRVNITKRTDESDLIGSYELVDGNTRRREGPVITAMRRGAILLLDETDFGTEDILCLQPILEGKPYFDKKTGEMVFPKAGFNIVATANTKGRGSEDGRYVGTNILNEAFLERFAITVEQEYPPTDVEAEILTKNFNRLGIEDVNFSKVLVKWADSIRESYKNGAIQEIISTRRLVHIAEAFSIFGERQKAMALCLNRFDSDTKTSFIDYYNKIDDTVSEELNANLDPAKFPPPSTKDVSRLNDLLRGMSGKEDKFTVLGQVAEVAYSAQNAGWIVKVGNNMTMVNDQKFKKAPNGSYAMLTETVKALMDKVNKKSA